MKEPIRRELLTWTDVDELIDHLVPQFDEEFDAMLLITRGGIVPGGLLAEALDIKNVLTAAVNFPPVDVPGMELMAWPNFLQFPERHLLRGRKVLIVDDVWGSGRTSTAVKDMVIAAGGEAFTCVLHYNPYRSLFTKTTPRYYAAVTDAYIVYPWEIDRGTDLVETGSPQPVN